MNTTLEPLRPESLKELFIKKFEELIFSGHYSIGEKLPPERELAKQLQISRPVVHEGLVDLAAKGLVTLRPRVGTYINDYRKDGSLFLLTSLFQYGDGRVSDRLLSDILDMRMLIEVESARLAAVHRREADMARFKALLEKERQVDAGDARQLSAIDFDFHHQIAIASGNLVYPLIMNSLKQFYTNVSGQFFADPTVVPAVLDYHDRLVTAIRAQKAEYAQSIMREMLAHGERHVKQSDSADAN